MKPSQERFLITPSEIGESVKQGGCPRYSKLRSGETNEEKSRDWKEAFQTLNPLLSESGRQFENRVYEAVLPHTHMTLDEWKDYESQEENDEKLRNIVKSTAFRDAGTPPTALTQAHFSGPIGEFFVPGDADLILLWPDKGDYVHIRVFDIKSSFEEKTYHQIQTACYTKLFSDLLDSSEASFSYEIDAGIIYKETNLETITPDELPYFNPEPRESDIERLLDADGSLHQTFKKELDEVGYQLDSVCESCPFNESCFTRSIESRHVKLLGLTRGEQKAFESVGLEKIEDVAELIDPIDDPRPYEHEIPSIRTEHQGKAQRLREDFGVSKSLPLLAQKSQSMLGELKRSHPEAHGGSWLPWIQGSGDGSLPEDDPPFETDMEIERGSLIRVYLNVQRDYIRNRIAIVSGRVTASNYNGKALTFGSMMTKKGVESDEKAQAEDERRILKESLSDLFESIKLVAELSGNKEKAPVHLYFYTQNERDALMDGVKRHPGICEADAVRDLLGLRAGVDQSMVSIVKNEVNRRMAKKTISDGMLAIMDRFYPRGDVKMTWEDWKYERESGKSVNLRDIFYHQIFDFAVGYRETPDGLNLVIGDEKYKSEIDGYYSSRGRFGANIPLEYIWAAKEIDELSPGWTQDPQYKGIIQLYRWHDQNEQQTRITREDVLELSKKYTHALNHVERGISFKNVNITKKPLPINDMDTFSIEAANLADACKDYLDIEYETSSEDARSLYQSPVEERILDGKSIPIEIDSFNLDDGFLEAEAHLIHDEFNFGDPDRVAMSSRVKGGEDGGSGSWMVATPLRELSDGSLVQSVGRPNQIRNATPVTVQSINARTGDVTLVGFPDGGKKSDNYRTWHKRWSTDPQTRGTHIESGAKFILDPQADDMTSERARNALESAPKFPIYNLIKDLVDGTVETPETDVFNRKGIDDYINWCTTTCVPEPNNSQLAFIGESEAQVALLQGPPGTGKTSGAMSHALLARALAFSEDQKHLRGLVSGASNKAVDELLADVASTVEQFNNSSSSQALQNISLIRFVGDPPANPIDGVEYINYHEDRNAMERLEQRLEAPERRQTTLNESTESQPHVLVFSTPSRVSGFINKHSLFSAIEPYAAAPKIFDLFAADEASMLPLPQFFLAGAFTRADGQILIGGDQRQMPPVQKHDWEKEDRRNIEELAPYLSTLDYFRLLRGDPVSGVEEEEIVMNNDADIPLLSLEETYRCHSTVAEFLRQWVYDQDSIDYTSSLTHTIPEIDGQTDGIDTVLESDNPISLVLHNDTASQQSNITEAKMAEKLVEHIPSSESIGIVTPHNSQKGLLSALCEKRAQVDTVERFQGGQRDVMILSATVSDPDYLDAESDFILSLNRLNVALSRMKKKLVILAPKTLFNVLPEDTKAYMESIIWKGLYSETGADSDSEWVGTLEEFIGERSDEPSVEVRVHTK